MTRRGSTREKQDRGKVQGLPDSELDVLGCLWRLGKATVRELRQAMADYRPMTHGAMATLLKRLEAKGLVSKKKGAVGKAFVYRAARRPEPAYREIMKRLHRRVFGGSGLAIVASLVESTPISDEELDALEALLDELRKKRAAKEEKR